MCGRGQPIDAGDEGLPYFPLAAHTDEYSRTKAEAEMLVLGPRGVWPRVIWQ
jgi:hypothetical protein